MSNSTETYKRRRYSEEEYDATEEEMAEIKRPKRKRRDYKSEETVAAPDAGKYVYVRNAELVNIRERPSLQAKVLKVVKNGDKLKLVSKQNPKDFRIVEYEDGKQGFIHADYTSFI